MDTQIRFLNELEEDLLEVAWHEGLGRAPAPKRRRGSRARRGGRLLGGRSRITMALAGGVAFLTLAGAIGYFVIRAGPAGQLRAFRPSIASEPSANAHGGFGLLPASDSQTSLGGMQVPQLASPMPSPVAGPVWGDTTQGSGQGVSFAGGTSLAGLPAGSIAGDLTRVVKTARLSVVVDRGTFADAFRQASLVASRFRGYVESSSSAGGKSGRITVRVPVARFDRAVNAFARLGTVQSQTENGESVSGQFVDLNARLRVWQIQLGVLQGLLAKATSIEQTMHVQNSIQSVLFQIDELKGQLRVLHNQTVMSTITLSLREEGAPVVTKTETVTKPDLGNAWQHALAGFLGVIFAIVVGLGYLVPISVLLALAWLVFRRVRARRAVA